MKLLVIGSGGREHALAWRLAQSPRIQKVFVAPGNAGTAREPGLVNLPITDIDALVEFARREQIQLTVVGPEAPLAARVVNAFWAKDLPIFGPTREAAQLASSKEFAKRFLQRYGIPTAKFQTFTDAAAALSPYFCVMKLFTVSSRIIITCSNRLSPYLQMEITALGYKAERVFKTGVELKGTLVDCIRLNLNLRCASQVLFSLKEFRAANADDLYKTLIDFPWEDILNVDGYFSISSNVSNETINNSLFANVKVKDAIVDRFRNKTGERPDSGPELDRTVIHLYWKDSLA